MITRLFALAASAAVIAFASTACAEDLDGQLAAAMKDSKIPAMGMLVIRDGKVVGEAVRGVRRNDGNDQVKTSDVWHLGSDGKAMTATMIARLVDKGVLRWDAPLDQMLPDLAATMRPEYRKVTLVNLLSSHAGLPHDYHDEKSLDPFYDDKRPLTEQRLAYLKLALTDAPVNTPGTTFSYSNTGFIVAAAIAERATHKSFEQLMHQEVFAPLGMTHAELGITHRGQVEGHTKGHPDEPRDANPVFFAPAGNVYMPLDDWARFCIDQINGADGHGKLLQPKTYALMQTAQPNGPYGLGWGVLARAAGRQGPVLTHSGSDGTWYAEVVLFPAQHTGVLITANAGEDMGADKVVTALIRPELLTLAPAAPADPAAPAKP